MTERSVHNEISAPVSGPVVQAGTLAGGVHFHAAPRTVVVPRQLPSPPAWFSGREQELDRLTAALDEASGDGATVAAATIVGTGGIGKTWLAIQWAYRNLHQFPDGQLFADFRGFAPVGEPMSPAAVVRGFLDALGVELGRAPVSFEAQLALYRSHLAGRKMLIVLDNVRDAASVVPLLPGSPSCTVLVTSRDRLPGLTTAHGARLLRIGVLSGQDARSVLVSRLGEQRVNAEPEAVLELLACCGGFPLALAIVASRAQAEPTFPLAALAESLGDDATRLGELDEDDPATSLPAVLSWSYDALTVAQSRAFVRLGGVPGPAIGLAAAASLLALPADRTGRLLRGLERVSMLRQETPGRYVMHDLVRLYAIDIARQDSPTEGDAATRRLVDYYLHSACAGDRRLYPDRTRIDVGEPAPGCVPETPADQAEALAWFGTEHLCYAAVHRLAQERGWHRTVWRLGWATANFRWRFGHLDEEVASARAGLHAAERLGEPAVLAAAHRLLGMALVRVNLFDEALDHLEQTLHHVEQMNDRRAMANAHASLATAFGRADNHRDALPHASRALTLFREVGASTTAEAEALNMVGWHAAWIGDHELARTSCERALALHRAHGYPAGEANTLDSLGFTFHRMGAYDQAMEHYQQALKLLRELNHNYLEAGTLDRLAQIHLTMGQPDEARARWEEALDLYRAQLRTIEIDRVERLLSQLG